jgi:formylglycine-generating enzyme required for sulfatase activity
MDKYEVTVGRFRAFVNAGMGTQSSPPPVGAGAHALISGTGWDPTWNSSLLADTFALRAALLCNPSVPVWTDTVGANENFPMNCLDWFEAFAFCAWDGGRLATEAEWNYAAAGGNDQRQYPWGTTTPSLSLAVLSCSVDGVFGCSLADLLPVGSKPAGNGKWGQSDLGGSITEWVFDWDSPYVNPCLNCVTTKVSAGRSVRGGSFADAPPVLAADARTYLMPGFHQTTLGARCASSR